jgi:integrase
MSVTIRTKKSRKGETVVYLDIYHNGKRKRMNLKTTDMREARQVKAQVERQLAAEGWGGGKGESMALKELARQYVEYSSATKAPKTATMDRLAMKAFMKVVGNIELGTITAEHFEQFRLERLKEISPTSVNIALRHLRAGFNWAVERGLLKVSPAAKVRLNRVPKNVHLRFLNEEEIARLRDEIEDDAELLNVVDAALWTGMRRNEIVTLQWSDIDLDRNVITVQNKIGFRTKSRKSRAIPINSMLREELITMKSQKPQPADRVFKLNYWSLGKRFLRATKAAKLQGNVTFHTLRHTFASHLVMQGVDLASIQEILGHFDVSVTMIYSHLSPGHLAKTVEKLPY